MSKNYDFKDPNNHPSQAVPARVYATLFDYDTGRWTLQPVSPVYPTAKKAKSEAYLIRRDLPDARYAQCPDCNV